MQVIIFFKNQSLNACMHKKYSEINVFAEIIGFSEI